MSRKLTNRQVAAILHRFRLFDEPAMEIARDFGLSHSYAWHLKAVKRYRGICADDFRNSLKHKRQNVVENTTRRLHGE